MDTSEIYIKMSDCEEIQALRPLDSWERYKDGDILFSHWPDGTSYPVEERKRRIGIYTVCGNNPEKYSKPIWLPTQGQLQEMVETGGIAYDIGAFLRYCIANVFPHDTWEQLWLAFVMKEKYNKTWDGENWKTDI